jgi:hypothetical protein
MVGQAPSMEGKVAMWKTLGVLLVLLHPAGVALSQPLDLLRVKLHVSADAWLQARTERCLAQEFQKSGNVEITDEAHQWFLDILVIDMKPGKGYILSMVIMENTTIELNHHAVYIPNLHVLYVDPDLPPLCTRAVAAFDNASRTAAKAAPRAQNR